MAKKQATIYIVTLVLVFAGDCKNIIAQPHGKQVTFIITGHY